MNEMRERLQALRSELHAELASDVALLTRSLDDKGEDVTVSQHPADVASDLYAREELVTEERTLEGELSDVEDALARIARGTYGTCVTCGRAIPLERLEALPQASRCIECQRVADRPRRR
jgi:DnaK suppressor protein